MEMANVTEFSVEQMKNEVARSDTAGEKPIDWSDPFKNYQNMKRAVEYLVEENKQVQEQHLARLENPEAEYQKILKQRPANSDELEHKVRDLVVEDLKLREEEILQQIAQKEKELNSRFPRTIWNGIRRIFGYGPSVQLPMHSPARKIINSVLEDRIAASEKVIADKKKEIAEVQGAEIYYLNNMNENTELLAEHLNLYEEADNRVKSLTLEIESMKSGDAEMPLQSTYKNMMVELCDSKIQLEEIKSGIQNDMNNVFCRIIMYTGKMNSQLETEKQHTAMLRQLGTVASYLAKCRDCQDARDSLLFYFNQSKLEERE
jgi:hypothetical protein